MARRLRYETDFPDGRRAGDVVVRVRAASLNYTTCHPAGMPGIASRCRRSWGRRRRQIARLALALPAGRSATGCRRPDQPVGRLVATCHGGPCRYCHAAHQLVRFRTRSGFVQARLWPCATVRARMMFTNAMSRGRESAGPRRLGGVGVCCVQLARRPAHGDRPTSSRRRPARCAPSRRPDHHYAKRFRAAGLRSLRKPARRGAGSDTGSCRRHYTGGDTWTKAAVLRSAQPLTCGAPRATTAETSLHLTFELKILGSNGWAATTSPAPRDGAGRPA